MNVSLVDFSKKEKGTVILAVTIGNLLEWYEIYLYVYWAPIISQLFFDSSSSTENLIKTYLLFAVGFLARPLGGLFFGRLGDRIGRRKALVLSIGMMTFPTFVTGLLPTHAQIGIYAPIILGIMRVLQSFPAGGELPGAFCYLYESAPLKSRRFMTSWAAMGYQLGVLISTIECFMLEKFLSFEDLIQWGWRLSFLVGGVFGLLGLFLRYRLHETPVYREMVSHEKIVKESILEVLNKHKKGLLMGFMYCALNSSAFYLMSTNFPAYLGRLIEGSYLNNLIVTAIILVVITVPLPLFGMLADRYDNRKMLIGSILGILVLLYPLCLALEHSSIIYISILLFIFALCFTCLSALVPYIISDLFPARVRFTCVGVSFNLVDALIGGFTPFVALLLLRASGSETAFCYILLVCSLISLTSYLLMKDKHPPKTF